jgi:arginyl-tRNA synthetase
MLFAVARLVGLATEDRPSLEFAPFGTILGEDGKPLKSREGDNVKLKDLLAEAEERVYAVVAEKNPELSEEARRTVARAVGIGAVKYADLSKDRASDYVFAWDKMLALEGNTGPYLQYAYARIRSIFRKSGVTPDLTAHVNLATPFELSLAKHILRLGEIVELVARELKPHHLSTYLYDLATKFSSFYENCPVLKADNDATRSSRLVLCEATARTLALGLDLLGIEHPEQM